MMWLGQSVDTSVIHSSVPEYKSLPVLTSLGCAIRRPALLTSRFGPNLKSTVQAGGPLMLDSGGFALMKNETHDWTAQHVSDVYDRVDADIVASLDVPPGLADERRARARKLRRTLDNLAILAPRFGARLMPVVQGRTPKEIAESCEGISSRFPDPAWIAIGGLVPLLQISGFHRVAKDDTPQARIAYSVRTVRSCFPNSILHVFGVGSIQTMLALFGLGAQSADSIGWRQAAGYGSIYLPGTNQRLLSWNSETPQPRPIINQGERTLLAQCNCPACRPIKRLQHRIRRLSSGFGPRSLHNLWVLQSEIDSLIEARLAGKEMEFLAPRLSAAWMRAIQAVR
jgi:tRNA-guanine family transglycosylase